MGNRINISVTPPTCLNGLELIFCRLDLKLLHEAREGHLERGMALHTPIKVSRDVNDRLALWKHPLPESQRKNEQSILVSRRPARLILGVETL